MTAPVSRHTAAHYDWGEGCQGWRLVQTEGLSVIEERMPPGADEVRHRHLRARQFFLVRSGVLDVEVEEERHRLSEGSGIEVPPGAAHQVLNPGPAAAEFLVISAPTTDGDRVPA